MFLGEALWFRYCQHVVRASILTTGTDMSLRKEIVFILFLLRTTIFFPTSLPKSALIKFYTWLCIQEKRRDLSRSSWFRLWKNLLRNELRNKYPTLSYIPRGVQHGLYLCGYTNRMSVALSSSLSLKLAISLIGIKQETHSWPKDFSPRMLQS